MAFKDIASETLAEKNSREILRNARIMRSERHIEVVGQWFTTSRFDKAAILKFSKNNFRADVNQCS